MADSFRSSPSNVKNKNVGPKLVKIQITHEKWKVHFFN